MYIFHHHRGADRPFQALRSSLQHRTSHPLQHLALPPRHMRLYLAPRLLHEPVYTLRSSPCCVVLPTLESVLYRANVSDILTRFAHPVLDIIARLLYGIIHYTYLSVLSLFCPHVALETWARTLVA